MWTWVVLAMLALWSRDRRLVFLATWTCYALSLEPATAFQRVVRDTQISCLFYYTCFEILKGMFPRAARSATTCVGFWLLMLARVAFDVYSHLYSQAALRAALAAIEAAAFLGWALAFLFTMVY